MCLLFLFDMLLYQVNSQKERLCHGNAGAHHVVIEGRGMYVLQQHGLQQGTHFAGGGP